MTKDKLKKRIAMLEHEQGKCAAQLNSINGQIFEAKVWLAEFDKPADVEKAKSKVPHVPKHPRVTKLSEAKPAGNA